ncbi:MAG TPA: uroporphyrinogen-III synthase, partial [Thermomicrobiaceae bacterium]|nr:uroporphyrinogen-III synthase [Thermomicrobiaceae bacterium]
LAGPLIAAIGPATARRLRAVGLEPALVPERFVAEEVLAGMLARGVAGRRVLLARAERARDVLPEGLRAAGANVDVVVAYRTVPGRPDPDALARVRSGEVDVVTLTSSSTARNLVALLGDDLAAIARARVVCIGPVTADTAREIGLRVDAVAGDYSIPGVVDAIIDLVRTREHAQRSRP